MDKTAEQIRDYRDLIVGKEAMQIAERVHSLTRVFQREEAFGLTSQMRRAAISIPSNIAEGFGRAQRSGDLSDQLPRCERLGKRLVQFVRSLERQGAGE